MGHILDCNILWLLDGAPIGTIVQDVVVYSVLYAIVWRVNILNSDELDISGINFIVDLFQSCSGVR